jgi:PPOX class probable F420-dependent enzyme
VSVPVAGPPHMPGYLARGAGGTLVWSWAEERLTDSHTYWVATVWPDGRPHVSPVWGVWLDRSFWFSCDGSSRKAKNIARDPRCVVTTEDPLEPVILDGTAALVLERSEVVQYVDNERVKYAAEWQEQYTVDFFAGGTYRVTPTSAFGLEEKTFGSSPTRWTF